MDPNSVVFSTPRWHVEKALWAYKLFFGTEEKFAGTWADCMRHMMKTAPLTDEVEFPAVNEVWTIAGYIAHHNEAATCCKLPHLVINR
jgi:hypothetical protein